MTTTILLVEDSATKGLKLRKHLESAGFEVTVMSDGEQGLEQARRARPDAIVSDVLMPRMDGFELCRRIRSDPHLKDLPIVLVTAAFDRSDDREFALRIGADAYFEEEDLDAAEFTLTVRNAIVQRRGLMRGNHPWSPLPWSPFVDDVTGEEAFHQEHAARLRSLVAMKMEEVKRSYAELAVAYDNVLESLIAALDLRDTETELHSWRVASYSLVLAKRAGLGWDELTDVERGALLHDIGKIGIADSIMRKPGPLDDDEWIEMRKHPQIGYEMVSGIEFLHDAAAIVLTHHERWDGEGYPNGLAGKDIPVGARVFALADTIDAITTDRPYRAAASFNAALEEIHRNRGSQFDPELVDLALDLDPDAWTSIREEVDLRRTIKRDRRKAAVTPPTAADGSPIPQISDPASD